MDKLSAADAEQLFNNSLICYEGRLIRVLGFRGYPAKFVGYALDTQSDVSLPFDLRKMKGLPRRIGFVNIGGHAVYLSRRSNRAYRIGLHADNVDMRVCHVSEGSLLAKMSVAPLSHPSILDSFLNRYPTILAASERAKADKGAVAFDKQFAVDYRGYIFYRAANVGVYKDEKSIVFNEGKEFLSLLLENRYEKDVTRSAWAKSL